MIVNSHAATNPMTSTHSSHECTVGSGSLFCQQSKAKAAMTDTQNCAYCMGAS